MPFKPQTFAHLCSAMQTGAEVTIDDTTGFIVAITKEDGSGYNWMVSVQSRPPLVVRSSCFIRVVS